MSACVVELSPHRATKRTPQGPIPVEFSQKRVVLNGVHIGYIGDHAEAPLCMIVRLDPRVAEQVRAEVASLRQGSIPKICQPPEDDEPEEDDPVDD